MRKIVLILTAIIGGSILGNLLALVAAAGIDASYGRSVTGGEWKFNLPNFLYAVFIGLLCGGFAGLIFKQKGWIIGGAAHILPGVVVFAIGFMNFSQNAPAIFSPNAWLWLVVGLVPAMLSGLWP
ncbi:MAG TPA: hypothetical protein PLU88_06405 [Armatimonadota bacterium]|nr:hypothetical protein [Armatimonadota bacterium]